MGANKIDLNVDMGEGCGNDEALIEYATSINVACGWHAGDAMTMRRVVSLALRGGVAIGAHPSFPDRENFGRTAMSLPPEEVYAGVQYQIGALAAIASAQGARLTHVKPHGALYNQAEDDVELARAIVHAVRDFDPKLAVFGLAGGQLVQVAREEGLIAIDEGFADRGYTPLAKLMPRSEPNAVIQDDDEACKQAIKMVCDGRIRSSDGSEIEVKPQTLCLHGDGAHAVEFARKIRAALSERGAEVVSSVS
ncbi:hypothetical protein WM40_25375 [Robbsia andropogonis]|uniref:5-oxoprolinase subunit A n=1 Tax=Robbsia andropogonis TaxID=28092 RepID=A0A0F5JTF3_9BURK|nr:5-oxoprolinase subunit PxpA [Robbsia andropogonis]KKB61063.1 hypothetical protein WM40_25375 [Robbsia andropogonis]